MEDSGRKQNTQETALLAEVSGQGEVSVFLYALELFKKSTALLLRTKTVLLRA